MAFNFKAMVENGHIKHGHVIEIGRFHIGELESISPEALIAGRDNGVIEPPKSGRKGVKPRAELSGEKIKISIKCVPALEKYLSEHGIKK